jgi:hypothetical protein
MLPASYQLPAALVLLLAGVVACFFGYRLFRIVLAIFGFILGVVLASSMYGTTDTWPMLGVAIAGGLVGALLLFLAYYVGVALVGAGLGVLVGNLVFAAGEQDPHLLTVILFSVAGAVLAMALQRYFLVIGTAFGGAWTLIVGAMALVGDPAASAAAASGHLWVVYPLDPAPGQQWVPIVWVMLGVIGTVVQLGWTAGRRRGR